MNRKNIIIAVLIIAAIVLIGCTAGPNAFEQAEKADEPAGFLLGIWHGFISLFAFIISLFSEKVNIYEVYNNGGWYNFGFIIGASLFYGGGTKGASRKRRDY
ncbi:MAG: hypothetical protein PQJ61_13505 [Spirochaetales bacterium]|uniref:Uncharacterized protein n=1 Tax=Candidatus Thalassospirochaeta sargassi TaxID=3119039 RepID=A0AAJ1II99_9SPIO|nr:hypothetical protein [Spirochaetales bacterium]